MDDADDPVEDTEDSPAAGRRAWRRRVPKILGGLLIGLLGLVGWLAVEAHTAKGHLEEARSQAVQTKDSLSKGHVEEAAKRADATLVAVSNRTISVYPRRASAAVADPGHNEPATTPKRASQ